METKKKLYIGIFIAISIIMILISLLMIREQEEKKINKIYLKGQIYPYSLQTNISYEIIKNNPSWIIYDSRGTYETYIEKSSDKKTNIGWYDKDGMNINTFDKLLYDCRGNIIKDDKNKDIVLKYETNKIPNINDLDGYSDGYFIRLTDAYTVNVGSCISLNPKLVYQNESYINFIEGTLNINVTLRKWNGEEFVTSPEDIWINILNNNTFKFGANDTIAEEDTLYQYEWISNKEIKYEPKGAYYYFDEYKSGETDVSNIHSRRILNVEDICSLYNKTENPNCIFELNNYYDINNTLNFSKLFLNFTGFYNESFGGVYIDPSLYYTNISTGATLTTNVRSEALFSHLSLFDDTMVLYMPFDRENTSTTVYDYSVNNNDGTLTGVTWNDTGYLGGAYDFDRDDDWIDTNQDIADGLSEITVCSWARGNIGDIGSNEDILTEPNSFKLYKTSSDTFRFQIFNDSDYTTAIGDTVYQDTDWHYVCGWYNGSHLDIYVDGIDDEASNIFLGGNIKTATNDLFIGYVGYGSDSWNGSIDEVMIFNRSLSAIEIAYIYNSTFQKFYKDGNQTFNLSEVSLGSDNLVNVTVKGQVLNDSKLNARVYGANVTDASNPSVSYINTDTATDNSLVGYWHFDNWSSYGENDTHVYDFSGNGNNGTVTDAVWNNSGKYGGAYDFDGDGDYIDINQDIADGLSEITVCSWAKAIKDDDVTMVIIREGSSFGVSRHSVEKFEFVVYNDTDDVTAISDTTYTDTNWHHVCGNYDGTYVDLYVDGVDDESATVILGGTIKTNSINPTIGYPGVSWNGTLDEVMIFNRSLSAEEIKSLYLTGSENHANNGVGINWTESSTGVQELTTFNLTHLRASAFDILPTSEYLLSEVNFNSTYGFSSSIVEEVRVDTYEADAVGDCWTTTSNGELYVPAGCTYYEEGSELYIPYT